MLYSSVKNSTQVSVPSDGNLKQNEAWRALVAPAPNGINGAGQRMRVNLSVELRPFCLLVCQVRVRVDESGLCCCVSCYSCKVSHALLIPLCVVMVQITVLTFICLGTAELPACG